MNGFDGVILALVSIACGLAVLGLLAARSLGVEPAVKFGPPSLFDRGVCAMVTDDVSCLLPGGEHG